MQNHYDNKVFGKKDESGESKASGDRGERMRTSKGRAKRGLMPAAEAAHFRRYQYYSKGYERYEIR
jgi:hypothetical protein